jgi:diamine N-acetyltransferase
MGEPEVTLREITAETVRAICKLDVRPDQRGDEPVGFVMLYADTEKPEYVLWRFMIAAEAQGKGFGRRALDLVVEHVRALPGARELVSSYVPSERGPGDFYRRYGFAETGEVDEGENVIRLEL